MSIHKTMNTLLIQRLDKDSELSDVLFLLLLNYFATSDSSTSSAFITIKK